MHFREMSIEMPGALIQGLLVCCFAAALIPAMATAQVPKKGVGNYPGTPNAVGNMYRLHVGWYYDWGSAPVGPSAGIQFVPMIWSHKNVNAKELAAAKACGAGILLGFNEPDNGGQANMTVEQALADWPQLEATGLRLGSPAAGTGDDTKPNGWLARFMAQARAKGYRVDFICIHPYQSEFDPVKATEDLKQEIEYVHDTYGLPIWVTEYGLANWGTNADPGPAAAAQFASLSARMMDKLPYVERYAWYSLIPNQGSLSLSNGDGTLNTIGQAWASAPGGTPNASEARAGT